MTPRKFRYCQGKDQGKVCGAVLSPYGPYLTGEDRRPLCSPCLLKLWEPEDLPSGDDLVDAVEDKDYLAELKVADIPATALRTAECECENPSRMQEEDGVRCFKCDRWLPGEVTA